MAEQNEKFTYQEQKKVKPKIEDIILILFDGDMQKDISGFVAYMQANKMSPVWASLNSWKCSYKNKGVCYIKFNPYETTVRVDGNVWNVSPAIDFNGNQFETLAADENLRDFFLANPRYCRKECHRITCAKRVNQLVETYTGVTKKILGKDFENMCRGDNLVSFPDNPDEQIIGYIKKIIEFKRQLIDNNA
jgi:hypothetical protein